MTGPGTARDDRELEHDELHLLLGAFVLGGLDPDEHRAFTRHLRTCPVCQREAAQLSGLPALLDLVEPAAADDVEEVSPPALAAATPDDAPVTLLARVRADRRRRRWRLAAVAAVLALVAGGIGASVGPIMARVNAPPSRELVAASSLTGSPVRVEIDLVTRAWGTQVDLRGTSLPSGQVLYLAVTDKEGHRYDVASWTGTPTGRATLSAACWMKTADITTLEVHTLEGERIATASA